MARSKATGSRGGKTLRVRARFRVVRAVVVFVVLMGLFYGFIHSPFVGPEAFQPYLELIASVSGGLIGFLGQPTSVVDTSVNSPDFSMRIVRGCDAIEPTAAFVAAVLASPVSLWAKIPGILIGTMALVVINVVRLVSLFFIGIYVPSVLDFMHFDFWQAAFIVLAICFWAIWVQWATRPRLAGSAVSRPDPPPNPVA
ncbi:MAG: archaeosortase/exosortase family protein [Planctomycetes bacterium]|nr:archaeosortase/exosortase family protein [Planctomycetota bacterium]